jgi:V/A-type H+-transporting ATPase subunit I
MTIIPLAKVTIFGLPQDKNTVLEGLQSLGCMHLISLQESDNSGEFVASMPAEDARRALRYIMDVRQRRHQLKVDPSFSLDAVVSQAMANQQQRREAEDRLLALRHRLKEIEPWGQFTLPDLADLDGYRLWLYQVPAAKSKAFSAGLDQLNHPWQMLHESPRNRYYAIVATDEPDPAALPVRRSHVGSESPQTVLHQLDAAQAEIDEINAEHQALSRWTFLLSKHLNQADDIAALEEAAGKTKEDDDLFLMQGWMPRRDLARLEAFTNDQGLGFQAEAIQPGDNAPTLLSNPPSFSGGQDLVTFYETPGYRDWDPSGVVFFSFALFFSMILADAGYALVLAVLIAVLWQGMGRSPGGRHFRILARVGLVFAFLYGVLAGSYFGIEPEAGSFLAHLKIIDLNDYGAMMKFSIVVGCLHLILANAVVAVREIGISGKAKPLGWIAVILGGLSMYVGAGFSGPFHLGVGLGVGGLLTVLLFSSDRKVENPVSALLRLLDGLGGLTQISKLFGDVMSYLRLFALGLASASLALTFNQLAGQVVAANIALGVPIALLILVLGHGINLLLAIISGFVHGLRLNYIEFFNWSLSEEGIPFQPFAKKETAS